MLYYGFMFAHSIVVYQFFNETCLVLCLCMYIVLVHVLSKMYLLQLCVVMITEATEINIYQSLTGR